MKTSKILHLFILIGMSMGTFFFLKQNSPPVATKNLPSEALMAQNTYFGPSSPIPGNPQLVRVEILINDSPESGGVEIQSVVFNGKEIPLKPRDIYGFRAVGSFQVKPGKYKLTWKVNQDKYAWPRTISHEEIVTVDPRDFWLQVSIVGNTASIR